MKIYNLNNIREQRNQQKYLSQYNTGTRFHFKKASGGEDICELSTCALEKYNKEKIVKLEKIKNIQLKDRLWPHIKERLEGNDKITPVQLSKIRNEFKTHIDLNEKIKQTAEILTSLFL